MPEGDRRAVILNRGDGTFEIVYERLFSYEEDEFAGDGPELPGYWRQEGRGKTVVESVGRGRRIVEEDSWAIES